MLANGAKLGYKKKGASGDYTDLTGLKEIPELGEDPEKVENSGLADKVKQYEYDAQVSVKRSGGGVNGVMEFDLNMALQSEITTTDPV